MDMNEAHQLRKAVLGIAKSVIRIQSAVIVLAREQRGKASYPEICDELQAAGKSLTEALEALERARTEPE